MKWLLLLVTGLLILPASAQKRLYKRFDASAIAYLSIRSDEVYSIRLLTGDFSDITVYTYAEGETHESVVLETTMSGDTLHLRSAYSPYFDPYNDKLAAHKVVAIEMEITVPSELGVDLEAAIASLESRGPVRSLRALLANGNCTVEDFSGKALLMTRKGSISVMARPGMTGYASSRYGTVSNQLPSANEVDIRAESHSGDIRLEVSQ